VVRWGWWVGSRPTLANISPMKIRFRAISDGKVGKLDPGLGGQTLRLQWWNEDKILSIGSCIYCESVSNLTDEHTVPKSIGGKTILKDAVCEQCRRETLLPENYCVNRLWQKPLSILSLGGSAQKIATAKVYDRHGTKLHVHPMHALPILIMPFIDEKSPIQGERFKHLPEGEVALKTYFFSGHIPTDLEMVNAPPIEIREHLFYKMIAKIAYTHFIFDQDSHFRNKDISIFCKSKNPSRYFIRSLDTNSKSRRLHEIGYALVDIGGGVVNVVSRVRLFPFLGMPAYFVNLGAPRRDMRQSLKLLPSVS